MIILGSASFLLFSYKGYDLLDDILTSVAGLFGLLICLFPCWSTEKYIGTFQVPMNVSSTIHNLSAGVFFGLLIYISLFQFTKSNGERDAQKKKRDIIYIVCGIGMLLAIIVWGITNIIESKMGIHSYGVTWAIEAVALVFFGISWLTKSNIYPSLFADKK
jgi:hypothetical protein